MFDDLQNKVRLKAFQIAAIKDAFALLFDAKDKLWLFGSRVDINKRGGDIDLYIETTLDAEQAARKRLKLYSEICSRIGEQKIDIVVNVLADKCELPIYSVARKEGIQLI